MEDGLDELRARVSIPPGMVTDTAGVRGGAHRTPVSIPPGMITDVLKSRGVNGRALVSISPGMITDEFAPDDSLCAFWFQSLQG